MNQVARRTVLSARLASIVVALAGIAIFVGWRRHLPDLTSLYFPGPTVKTNAALCLVAGGCANLVLSMERRGPWRILAFALAIVPAALGALTLSEHIVGWNLGIDQLLATEPAGALATVSPNRMGPPSSTVNVLLGLALMLRATGASKAARLSHVLALVATLLTMLPLMGYAYGMSGLYAIAQYTGISIVNAAALLTLALAIQGSRPDMGLAGLFVRGDEAGVFARRLLPAAILLPFLVGWLLSRALQTGLLDAPFAVSGMALLLMLLLAGVIWRTGIHLVASLDARAATEAALSERERTLRETDQQKTQFLATLSHELRNPLAPIRFAVELLNGPPAVAERARHTIERQVRHLTRLIDDLLDLTRITRNKLELHIRPCDLRQLVNDAVDAVQGEITAARHELDVDLPPQRVWLNVDPDRVVQMVVNLLTNASRYSEPGGRIVIGAIVADADVTISVRDSGHGIDPDDCERVFEPFVQVGRGQHGGLGIGLALVKALADLHHGSVDVDSEGIGHGSVFRVRLPRAAAPAAVDSAPVEGPRVAPCRILVVDDNRDAADMLHGLLSESGHQVTVAYDGEDALGQAAVVKPQVALLDIGMPGMDGYELAERLRKDPTLADLFLDAITGWGQEEDRRRALAAGFDAHLAKPADPAHLNALLASRFPAARAETSSTASL